MNTQALIQDLILSGKTQGWISEQTGICQPSISNILSGKQKQVMRSKGDALLATHKRIMRQKQKTLK